MKSLFLVLPVIFTSVSVQAHQYYYRTSQQYHHPEAQYYYQNQPQYYCKPVNTALGALLGGGIAASMSRGRGYAWSVPIGAAVGGTLIGCRRY